MKKKTWLGIMRKRFYSKMKGNAGEWACENLVGFSMYDGPMETIEHIWVNI